VVARRTMPEPLLPGVFGVAAVLFAVTTGVLAVPAGPAAARLMLGSAAAAAVSLVVLRCTGSTATALTALAVGALLATAVSATALMWRLDAPAAGALLAVAPLVVLGAAPRLSIALTRIGPPLADEDTCGISH